MYAWELNQKPRLPRFLCHFVIYLCLLYCQIPEDDEVFLLRLTGVEGGALLRANSSSVQLRIRRNDSPLRFSHSIMVVPESAGVIALNVTRGRLTEDGPLVGSVDTEVAFYMFIHLPDFQSIVKIHRAVFR